MTQAERRLYLIQALMQEKTEDRQLRVPRDAAGQRILLRGLMNVRAPQGISADALHELAHHFPDGAADGQARARLARGL